MKAAEVVSAASLNSARARSKASRTISSILFFRVAYEITAGIIKLAGKHGGDFTGAFAQARFGLLSSAFREMLNLRLRFFLVPLRGFQQIIDHLVLGGLCFAFKIG